MKVDLLTVKDKTNKGYTPPTVRTNKSEESISLRRKKLRAGYIPTESKYWIPTGLSTISTMTYFA